MTIAFHEAAREEARAAFLFLAADDPKVADDFELRLRLAIAEIGRNPEACRLRKHGVRRKNVSRFKRHYVAYMIWQNIIVIIAVGHASRRPFYWYRRPKEFGRTMICDPVPVAQGTRQFALPAIQFHHDRSRHSNSR